MTFSIFQFHYLDIIGIKKEHKVTRQKSKKKNEPSSIGSDNNPMLKQFVVKIQEKLRNAEGSSRFHEDIKQLLSIVQGSDNSRHAETIRTFAQEYCIDYPTLCDKDLPDTHMDNDNEFTDFEPSVVAQTKERQERDDNCAESSISNTGESKNIRNYSLAAKETISIPVGPVAALDVAPIDKLEGDPTFVQMKADEENEQATSPSVSSSGSLSTKSGVYPI